MAFMALQYYLMILCNESHEERGIVCFFVGGAEGGHTECMHMPNKKNGFVAKGKPGTCTPLLSVWLLKTFVLATLKM